MMGAISKAKQWHLPNNRGSYETAKPIQVRKTAVIGGGTMGRGIAISLCRAGYDTMIVEYDQKGLDACKRELDLTYKREMKLKRMQQGDVDKLINGMKFTLNLEDTRDCDLIVEAVFEEMAIKKELFKKLDKIVKPDATLASNTSTLDFDEMSSVLSDRTRLVGMHFFNPPHVIKVVEIVFGSYTSAQAVATAFATCDAMKKFAVLVGNCPFFVFNRLLFVYLAQAHKLLYQYGIMPKHVDAIVVSYGFLMGPLTMNDMNGHDVGEKLKKEWSIESNPIEKELYKRKRYGRKNGKGFYRYDPKTQKKEDDPEIEGIIERLASQTHVNMQLYSDSDMIEFLFYPLVNEGFLCVEEGIIEDESLVDLMFIFGFGWPPATGGPMRWGRKKGLRRIAGRVAHWHILEPERREYKISKTLEKIFRQPYLANL
ncbi:hypothetical protein WR25_15154 [Diploscapter pachys]|uniref:3-hydroxyacyl-CoA dehydrogenase NAD binding domain-containing protein n=1 Tax=Diploscapter pachys TaxID=2018661 RepID=A0A2A2K432_9BILA|nr:hypothetical protein WR25_15154 [Diploscapter pachys]